MALQESNGVHHLLASTPDPHTTISIINQQKLYLLHLPAELRNKIYEYVFGGLEILPFQAFSYLRARGASYRPKGAAPDTFWVPFPNPVSVMLVCKQIHTEMALLPFQLNTFNIIDNANFQLFTMGLEKAQRNAIKVVRILYDDLQEISFQHYLDNTRPHSWSGFGPFDLLFGLRYVQVEMLSHRDIIPGLTDLQSVEAIVKQLGGCSWLEVVLLRN